MRKAQQLENALLIQNQQVDASLASSLAKLDDMAKYAYQLLSKVVCWRMLR